MDPATAPSLLTESPPATREIAAAISYVLGAYESLLVTQERIEQARLDADRLGTELVAVTEAVRQTADQRAQMARQLEALDQQRLEHFETLRQTLEERLQDAITDAREQIEAQLQDDLLRQVSAFKTRQSELIQRNLDDELRFEERQIRQLAQEIEIQSHELRDQLARLQIQPDVAHSLEETMRRAMAQRVAGLQARREGLRAEHDQLLAKLVASFSGNVQGQYRIEAQRRLMFKEAGLRQALAEFLQRTRAEAGPAAPIEQACAKLSEREQQLQRHEAQLRARLAECQTELASLLQRAAGFQEQRKRSLGHLEQVEQPSASLKADSAAWIQQVMRRLPSEVVSELALVQQRMMARTEQERHLKERDRVLREREVALQVSRQMQEQYQRSEQERQRASDETLQQIEALLTEATAYESQGELDRALERIKRAEALKPPLPIASTLFSLEHELMARKDAESHFTEVQSTFAQAMRAFEQGQYDQAVALFEQIIAHETSQRTAVKASSKATVVAAAQSPELVDGQPRALTLVSHPAHTGE